MRPDQEPLINIANAIRQILRYTNGISKLNLESTEKFIPESMSSITVRQTRISGYYLNMMIQM